MNQTAALERFARESDPDVFLLAGRYTLLEQTALQSFLPLCAQRGIAVVAGGVFNSGLLADAGAGARYNYDPAPADLIARTQRLSDVCQRFRVPLKAAALQFPIAHPVRRGGPHRDAQPRRDSARMRRCSICRSPASCGTN